MTKIKICGLRREKDIEFVNNHMPDYVGFVFAESKRRISPEEGKILINSLDRRIKKAGIFVNESLKNILRTILTCKLDIVQLHGEETKEFVKTLKQEMKNVEVWKAVRVKAGDEIKTLEGFKADAYLLDAYSEGSYGGAGKTFDWHLAVKAKEYGRIILAGGLQLSNIKEAVGLVQPYGVDISSGVETEGFKDSEKIKSFIYAVRRDTY